jgi:hypothetical protein
MPYADPVFIRSRIAILLNDVRIAERVRRRLPQPAPAEGAGTPPCFRAAGDHPPAPLRIKAGQCRALCGGVDCLCGAYPRTLTPEEVSHGPRLEPVAP